MKPSCFVDVSFSFLKLHPKLVREAQLEQRFTQKANKAFEAEAGAVMTMELTLAGDNFEVNFHGDLSRHLIRNYLDIWINQWIYGNSMDD